MLRNAFAIIGCTLALVLGIAYAADAAFGAPRESATVTDRFGLADRIHVRVFEDGSARVCYPVRVWPLDYQRTLGHYVRVCGGVGVPW